MAEIVPGDVIKRLRAERGRMSQEALAERVRAGGYRLSTSAITRIERGVDSPTRATVEAIDRALDADGEVLHAFGFVAPSSLADEITALRAEVVAQRAELDEVRALLEEMTAVLEQVSETGQVRGSWPAPADG